MNPRRLLPVCPLVLLAVFLNAAFPADIEKGRPSSGDPPVNENSHPLIHEWHREGFNLWAEIKTALEQKAYQDVAQLIFEASPEVERGLLVDFKDPQLLVPYHAVISQVIEDYPRVRETLWEQYGKLAPLRVGAAVAAGNREALQTLAIQFRGSEAAVDALCRLGDHCLAAGHFGSAMRHYEQALGQAGASQRPGAAARLRLSGAMLGSRLGEPVQSPVQFGKSRLSAAEFERMIGELVKARASEAPGRDAGGMHGAQAPAAPSAARFAVQPFPSREPEGKKSSEKKPWPLFDWSAGTLSVVAASDTLVVCDGRRLGTLKLASGEERWLHEFTSLKASPPPWKGILFRPLIAAGRVYVRHWTEKSLEVNCLDLGSGELVWTSGPLEPLVVSDPLVDRGRLLFLTAMIEEPAVSRKGTRPPVHRPYRGQLKYALPWQLQLTALDPASGKLLDRWPLVRLQSKERMAPLCQATAAGDAIVVSFSGGALCVDLAGRPRWVRRQASQDTAAQPQGPEPPLVAGREVFLAPPAANAVQCLDLASGRLRWECPAPNVTRLIGIVAGRLIAQDGAGLLAIDTASGQVGWRHAVDELLQGFLCGGPGQLAYTVCRLDELAKWSPALVWLDPLTGQPAAERFLDGLRSNRPMSRNFSLGPVIAVGSRLLIAHHDPGQGRSGLYRLELAQSDDGSPDDGIAIRSR